MKRRILRINVRYFGITQTKYFAFHIFCFVKTQKKNAHAYYARIYFSNVVFFVTVYVNMFSYSDF